MPAKKKTTKKTTKKKTKKKPSKSVIAAQLFSFNEQMKTAKATENTLKKLKKIGYQNVQISGNCANLDPFELKAIMDKVGVKAIGAHVAIDQFRENIDAVIDKLLVWDCNYVAIPYLAPEERGGAAKWKKLAKEANKYGKILATEDIVLQYHNHDFEFEKYAGKTALEIIYENSDRKYLQAELDTHWVVRGGCDPVAWCLRMKNRMDQVHLKDFIIHKGAPTFAEIGEGNMNFPAILHACKVAGVKDYIVEQDSCLVTKNPFKSFAMSLKNLNKMGLR